MTVSGSAPFLVLQRKLITGEVELLQKCIIVKKIYFGIIGQVKY